MQAFLEKITGESVLLLQISNRLLISAFNIEIILVSFKSDIVHIFEMHDSHASSTKFY